MAQKEKWKTLEHNGPLFPQDWIVRGWTIKVKGRAVTFVHNSLADEMTYHWASKLATSYVQDSVFQKNFWSDYESVIRESHDFPKLKFPDDFDFEFYYNRILDEREEKKNRSKEEKKAEKEERERKKELYGKATLNGVEVELGNYTVEPPGLFMGRGKHPLRGHWKPRVYPEDVTLNLSSNASTPQPPQGHQWKEVVENKNALWTAMWHEKLTGAQKRILFSPSSFVRQHSDQKKFEKAAELSRRLDEVHEFIEKKLSSADPLTRELSTVCYLIAHLSIRVGDEKGDDTADTVGASSLRYEHITLDGSTIILDFLGKDSIRYYKKVDNMHPQVMKNIKELIESSKKGEMIFSHSTSRDVNEFLGLAMDGLTAKQFRTAKGSSTLSQQLKSQSVPQDIKDTKKMEYFTEANLVVAKELNHQSAVSEAYDRSLKNMKEKLKGLRSELKSAKSNRDSELIEAKSVRDSRVESAKKRLKGQKKKEAVDRAKKTYENKKNRFDKKVDRLQDRIDALKSKIRIKEQTKGIALNTSRLNYADPRIPISWCKDHDVEVKRVYPQTAQKKFSWAMDVDEDFYKRYPEIEE